MGGKVTHVTDATFESTVVNSDKPAMVDFWATWCGPCRMIAPHVEALADEYTGKAVVAKLDVDSNRQTAIKFGIQSIPTLLYFEGGGLRARLVGTASKEAILAKLRAASREPADGGDPRPVPPTSGKEREPHAL